MIQDSKTTSFLPPVSQSDSIPIFLAPAPGPPTTRRADTPHPTGETPIPALLIHPGPSVQIGPRMWPAETGQAFLPLANSTHTQLLRLAWFNVLR
ncbi:hypothetical protein CDV36_016203 [Fusarium kuroshium]|uniref:Uncharacterized protein n=1 Tax=Fusarium kuroshium TaxID=2010991 RepID=A0A3M2QY00_9HYPO|nr:hypothetical protein CDV36_016203 [Fusarium kuroshium]